MPETSAVAPQFVSARHRDETAELGMWIFIASEVLLFGGLMLGYFVYRHAYPAAFGAAIRHTDIVIGAANTAILLTSSLLVACAVDAPPRRGESSLSYCCQALSCSAWPSSLSRGLNIPTSIASISYRALISASTPPMPTVPNCSLYSTLSRPQSTHMLVGISLLAVLARLNYRSPGTRHRAALHSAALY
jgi:cytochrome c oxidase subunit 3